jgi:hypothetical protein
MRTLAKDMSTTIKTLIIVACRQRPLAQARAAKTPMPPPTVAKQEPRTFSQVGAIILSEGVSGLGLIAPNRDMPHRIKASRIAYATIIARPKNENNVAGITRMRNIVGTLIDRPPIMPASLRSPSPSGFDP